MHWEFLNAAKLVVVRGIGVIDLEFLASFRAEKCARGAIGYRALFDLSRAAIQLSDSDLQTLVARARLTDPELAGPVALVLGRTPPPLLLDMAVLMKLRLGNRRRIRLFTENEDAKQWLFVQPVSEIPPGGHFPAWLSRSQTVPT